MWRKTMTAAALLTGVVLGSHAQTVNLIENGSFENPGIYFWEEVSHSLFGEDIFCDSSCSSGFLASDGQFYVLIAGGTFTQTTTGVVRSRQVFVPTHATVLEFDWATLGSGPDGDPCAGDKDGLTLLIDGVQVWSNLDEGSCVNVIPYATVVIDLQALGVNDRDYHVFEFRGAATGIPPTIDISNVYLDNVRLPVMDLPDTDGDGIDDTQDNCVLTFNVSQCDGDNDGIGSRCDADLNNDCVVNAIDLGLFKSVFFTSNPIGDLNCDGIVNTTAAIDLGIFRLLFHEPVGPSGIPNVCDGSPGAAYSSPVAKK